MATATADLSLSYLELSLCTSALLPESWVHPDHCIGLRPTWLTSTLHTLRTLPGYPVSLRKAQKRTRLFTFTVSQEGRERESGTATDRTSSSGALIGADLFRRLSNIQSAVAPKSEAMTMSEPSLPFLHQIGTEIGCENLFFPKSVQHELRITHGPRGSSVVVSLHSLSMTQRRHIR